MEVFQIKHLYICVIPSVIPSPHFDAANAHAILTPHVMIMKINDCGFKFSMASQQHVLIKEDKDNLLQFAKVFPAKF